MSKIVVDDIERTEDYIGFIEQLKTFHATKGTTLLSEPVLGGKKVDLYKLYQEVIHAGGFDQVTKKRSWKQIGEIFEFPSTCTNSAYILKGLYIRNLLGWEEEQVWRKEWVPPAELKGPEAHKASTLAGKSYRKNNIKSKSHPYIPSGNETFILPSPFSLIKTEEIHQCEVSERHHITQPIEHVHSTEHRDNRDCVTGFEFDESSKINILSALQSQNPADIDWALNKIVTISYECPQKLLVNENPILLNTLIKIADHCLQETMFVDQTTNAQKVILKILHIMRNFSFIESNILASSSDFKQMLIKCLVTKDSSHYSHCIDILENMAPLVQLGPFDSIIGCLNNLLLNSNERSVLLGSIRILTKLTYQSTSNLHYLLPSSSQTTNRITQFLIANDEELTGVSLEYLYQYSSQSVSFGQYLLSLHNGANIGILVSLLMAPHKYYRTSVIPDNLQSADSTDAIFLAHEHGSLPCVPNLSLYQQLDEPYRCLGWLKDKFELTNSTSELSLDDMYLLYEMRFGHEKALRIQDFYTVIKIAFPIVKGSPKQQQGAVLEGTTIRGLQVKMCILQDEVELMCEWVNCSQSFNDEQTLQSHILHEHVEQPTTNCLWVNCDMDEFSDRNALSAHIKNSHLPLYIDNSEIEGVALVAVQLLKVLSKNPNSHGYFMPHEQELVLMSKRRPKLASFIESIFSNFTIYCSNTSSASSSTTS